MDPLGRPSAFFFFAVIPFCSPNLTRLEPLLSQESTRRRRGFTLFRRKQPGAGHASVQSGVDSGVDPFQTSRQSAGSATGQRWTGGQGRFRPLRSGADVANSAAARRRADDKQAMVENFENAVQVGVRVMQKQKKPQANQQNRLRFESQQFLQVVRTVVGWHLCGCTSPRSGASNMPFAVIRFPSESGARRPRRGQHLADTRGKCARRRRENLIEPAR